MKEKDDLKSKEHQTLRLFTTLGVLTLIAVLLFRVVLFGPFFEEKLRQPADLTSQADILKK